MVGLGEPLIGIDGAVCPSCRSATWTEVRGRNRSFELYRCNACGCYRIQDPAAGGAGLYEDDYYSGGSAKRLAGVFDVLWRWKRRSRARFLLRHAPEGARVCDIGCERGELLNLLSRAGCRAVGTQLSRSAAEFAGREFGLDVFVGELMEAPFAAGPFDIVLMLNVLEHLPDPDRYVGQVARMLNPGGTFWIEIPNAGSFTARLCGKNWLHHDPPHHFWAFDQPGIARLLDRHGFAIDHVYHQSWEFGPIGCLQSWLNALPGRKNVIFDVVRRGLSPTPLRLTQELAYIALSALLLPLAAGVAVLESWYRNGQVILIRARKR